MESMNIEQSMHALAVQPLQIGSSLRGIQQRQPEDPIQRKYHSAVLHKSSLYLYGGLLSGEVEDQVTEQTLLYRYNLSSKAWTRIPTNFLSNAAFSNIYAHSAVVYNNMMYLFGGRNFITGEYIVGLWCLNLQSYNWKRQELKGYSPQPRQHATMVLHQRSSIVLYGGKHASNNCNDFHIYKVDTKTWMQIQQSSYDLKIPCRLKPALCSQGDHLYLFGGERTTVSGEGTQCTLLKDFYQLKIINKPMSSRPDLWVKFIVTGYCPPERASALMNINDKYLLLWGGQSTSRQSGFWLYSIGDVNWIWVKFKQSIKKVPLFGYSINYLNEKCFVFGQYEHNQQQVGAQEVRSTRRSSKYQSGLITFNIELKQIQYQLSQSQYQPRVVDALTTECWECSEQYNSLAKHKYTSFTILKEMLEESLSFPYSALGLLIDNSLLLAAKETRVLFSHNFKERYCLIQDNGISHKMWPKPHDFVSDMLTLRTYVEENIDQLEEEEPFLEQQTSKKSIMMPEKQKQREKQKQKERESAPQLSMMPMSKQSRQQKQQKQRQAKDKEMEKILKRRKRIAKEQAKKKKEDRIQYSHNLKLGALRIGDKVLFVSRYGSSFDNRRVFVIEKVGAVKEELSYRAYYYIYQNGCLVDPLMDTAKKYIDEEYHAYFKVVNDHKEQSNNFVFVTGLKEMRNERGELEAQLKESTRHNDIFYCQKRVLENLEDGTLWDSIDVSLRNYLSTLYLKSDDSFKMYFGINEHRMTQISNSDLFDKIDSMVKSQRLIDLMHALDLQNCSIIQAYYNKSSSRARELNRKSAIFSFLNGVLFYHKNRLISRYRFRFGDIHELFNFNIKTIQETLLMFGFIQIQPQFAVNIFKTAFVREDLLQEAHLRLQFVQKYADLKVSSETKEETVRRPPEHKHESRKRFRHNEQAQSWD